ncbi:hypothetical protein [Streptomyces sp. CA-111067]|uniref:hypothetical protein n=1 Tax=Streptomyces sp. CA-111067 TaxID=3240046 RepID=UPI003D985841
MTERQAFRGRRRAVCSVSAAGLALVATAFAFWFEQQWKGRPYPVANPAATARRLDDHTQTIYDALGLPDAELATDWPGAGLTTDPYTCPRPGLRHLSDGLMDSPPSEPRTVKVNDDWALKDVTRAQAVPALQRARTELTRAGWRLTSYEDSTDRLQLSLRPPNAKDTVSVEAYPGDRLQITASTGCARYPAGTPMRYSDDPELPPQQAPAQLR